MSRHARHRIACCVRSDGATAHDTLFLQVHTCITPAIMLITPTSLDFGQVAQGKAVTRSLEIRNGSSDVMHLTHDALGITSAFSLLNACRDIQPGATHMLVIQFQPQRPAQLEQRLTLRCATSHVDVMLSGQCVAPTITLTPERQLDMGDVMLGDTATRTFTITNHSSFAYPYDITHAHDADADTEHNHGGLSEFFGTFASCVHVHGYVCDVTCDTGVTRDITICALSRVMLR